MKNPHASSPEPRMSVVLATPDSFETVRKTVGYLRNQTALDALELVLVAPSLETLGLDEEEVEGFCRYQIVEIGRVTSIGAANAAGVRRATAPIVALTEDHVCPDPTWAEALLAAHKGPWVAVGVAVRNGNPDNLVSWADLFIGYAPWLDPIPSGPVEFLPGHNTSYKRDALLAYGDDLEKMLDAETVLHWNMRAKGLQIRMAPAARIGHVNFARLATWIPVQFHAGRVFGASRAGNERWSAGRRALYACGAPLIPLVRLRRIVRDVRRRSGFEGLLVRSLPLLTFGLGLDALGQMAGYAFGVGGSLAELPKYEFHRYRHNARGG
jgi:hypothetical protein